FASNASSAVCPILPNRLPKAPSSSEYGNRKLDPPRFVAGRLESGPDLPHRAWPLGSEVRSRTYEDGADFVHHRVEGVRLAVELRHRRVVDEAVERVEPPAARDLGHDERERPASVVGSVDRGDDAHGAALDAGVDDRVAPREEIERELLKPPEAQR